MKLSSDDIRQKFLEYFKGRNHKVVPSDSLIPSTDPTLLFTSAGMVQFKPNFLGQTKLNYRRAASSQKCLRTSDIEKVGFTLRHLTFFEMLGNFAFGNYFKADAIEWCWEFLTREMGLDASRLYASVFIEDKESYKLWKKHLPESRIAKLGEDTNFWTMGTTGPCGPCSEIIIDMGENKSCGPRCGVGSCDCDRWIEVWNLVFTQYDRQKDGTMKNLPQKNIDTGMGLERLVSIIQGVPTCFDIDIFRPLLNSCVDLFNKPYGRNSEIDNTYRLISDHVRAITFLVSEGIMPSNEGRGYILRRLLRRALRQGAKLGHQEPFLYRMAGTVGGTMRSVYPELTERRETIAYVIKQEEGRFMETLESGTIRLEELTQFAKEQKATVIHGEEIFKLYDTYGFPPDLTGEILTEHNLSYNEDEFKKAQIQAQEKAREAWKGSGAKDMGFYISLEKEIGDVNFVGYDTTTLNKTSVKALLHNQKRVKELPEGSEGEVILKTTPFYAESGGQVGDTGRITQDKTIAEVTNTQKFGENLIVHQVKVTRGTLKSSSDVKSSVDSLKRNATKRHHTATHLLHAALRKVLGTHVAQSGSLVAPDRLRFDYTHTGTPSPEDIVRIEDEINKNVLANISRERAEMTLEEAKKKGALALFGEKYRDRIFGVGFGNASMEVCGGTHCASTGEVGSVKIISESSIGTGLRRIEAVAGIATLDYLRSLETSLKAVTEKLKISDSSEAGTKIDKLLKNQKSFEREVEELKVRVAQGKTEETALKTQEVHGINCVIKRTTGLEERALRTLSDRLKEQIKSGVVIVVNVTEDKVSFVIAVTSDVKEKGFYAGNIAKNLASKIDGQGGGRKDFAQGGSRNPAKLEKVLKNLPSIVKAS